LELIQAEKLESIGRLAAGVAHEVKNPLAVLQLGIDYLCMAVSENEEVAQAIEEMDTAVKKADRVIKDSSTIPGSKGSISRPRL